MSDTLLKIKMKTNTVINSIIENNIITTKPE